MLANAAIVEAVAAAIDELELPLVVVDPVLVSTSGERLLDEDGVRALCAELLPRARVVTPNIPEAEVLSGRPHPLDATMRARRRDGFTTWAPAAVIITGGHASTRQAPDIDRRSAVRRPRRFTNSARRASSRDTRTAPAARSRRRSPPAWRSAATLPDAAARAQQYVAGAIAHALAIGHGQRSARSLLADAVRLSRH